MKRRLFACMGALLLSATPASAQASRELYQGKEVRLLVGYAAGGGYDAYARAISRVLGRHLPGNPTVIVQNMPGADGLSLANHMAQRAPRDGTVIAITNRNLAVASQLGLVDKSSAQYDSAKFRWIANLNVEVGVVVVRSELGIKNVDDLRQRQVVVGATGTTANNAIYPVVVNAVLGTKLKVVTGYPGTSHLTLALERGEIEGIGGSSWASLQVQRPDWIREGKVVPIVQLGTHGVPELKDVPLIIDLVRSDEERRALELIFAPDMMGRAFFAPPETPGEAVTVLRKAFAAAVEDPDFKETAERARLDVTFTDGALVQDMVMRLHSTPPEVVELARRLMQSAAAGTEKR